MNPTVCICCGEPINSEGNTLSRNPNMCASCSSISDGMDGHPPDVLNPAHQKTDAEKSPVDPKPVEEAAPIAARAKATGSE